MALPRALRVLSAESIVAIDEALHSIGAFGEVRLIKKSGKLRYIENLVSESPTPGQDQGAQTQVGERRGAGRERGMDHEEPGQQLWATPEWHHSRL